MENTKEMIAAERDWIGRRRRHAGQEPGDPGHDAVGLALSGGGVRSATFNLGVLQALERYGLLKSVDYLSTVSGGGYIGAALTWFCNYLSRPFPFGASRKDAGAQEPRKVLHWLREHGSYLTPGHGLSLWSLVGAVIMGIFLNLLVLVPVFLLATFFLALPCPLGSNSFGMLLRLGALLLLLFLGYTVIYALLSGIGAIRGFAAERRRSRWVGALLAAGAGCMVVGSIPEAYEFIGAHLKDWVKTAMSLVSLSGIAAILGVLKTRSQGNERKGGQALALAAGLALLAYGVFLWFYHVMHGHPQTPEWLWPWLGLSVALAVVANINHVSMHRYYRNRLMEAYLPYGIAGQPVSAADECFLKDLAARDTSAPYPLINANLQTVGSSQAKLRQRGGENFIFAPAYCGSDHTAYVKTAEYVGGNMNLATAFAISGAAVDANSFSTRSRPLAFFMALLNVRLGYWILNPRHADSAWLARMKPWWHVYLFKEMLGGVNEESWHVHLSDGGHFENLGLYELVRRKCRRILVSDAGADPQWTFEDLANAVEKARVDFGARIEIDVSPLFPKGEDRRSPQASVRGKIVYADNTEAELIYMTTALIEGLSEDIYGYHRAHSSFPDEPTKDQFFDEAQFEAYRELGFQVCRGAIPLEERLRGEARYQASKTPFDPDCWAQIEEMISQALQLGTGLVRNSETVDKIESAMANLVREMVAQTAAAGGQRLGVTALAAARAKVWPGFPLC